MFSGPLCCNTDTYEEVIVFIFYFIVCFCLFPPQPIGALLLEQCRVEKEDSQTFSIGELQHPQGHFQLPLRGSFTHLCSFYLPVAFLDEAERKYVFECDTEEQCKEWIDSIIKAR